MTFDYSSSYFQLCSFAYILLLAFVFFPKKKLKTIENKIYTFLIISNLVGIIIDIASLLFGFFAPESPWLIILAKAYLIYLIAYLSTCLLYFVVLAYAGYSSEKKTALYKVVKKWILILGAIISVIILALPLYFHTENGVLYSYGPSAMMTYIFSAGLMLTWIVMIILKRKNMAKNTLISIIIISVAATIVVLIQFFNPEILLVSSVGVFCTIILYLTVFLVENPDVQMLEEIKEAKKEAERANKSKTEFLSNMSHEIRTPLNAILGFSQALLEENLTGESKEDAENIVNASDSLLSIVNEILDISKIESNKLEIENAEYSFEKIYKYLVTMTEGRLGNKSLEFIHECADNIPVVLYGDSVRIKQIVVNLLTNSVKYTQRGYVKLTIGCDILNEETCRLTISVEDSGIGIKKEDLNKMFSKFERFDSEKNINVEGTGLGLNLTKTLVELLGGTIEVDSVYGEGSKFTVVLDQKIVKYEQSSAENDQATKKIGQGFIGSGQKVLIVDDNNVNLKVTKRMLQHYNLDIEFSNSGKDFIKKVAAGNKYDLVMLDDMMPEMSGVETLKYLKENTDYSIPTICLTANALAGMKEIYLSKGFDEYLSKPIDRFLLEEILNKFLKSATNVNQEEKQEETQTIATNETVANEQEIEENIELL